MGELAIGDFAVALLCVALAVVAVHRWRRWHDS